jgi:DNA-binding MarR family transcriptional regulator
LIATLKHLLHGARMENAQPNAAGLQNPLEPLIGYQIRQASLAITSDLSARLEALSLTVISLSVLLMIESNPGLTQSHLCRHLGVKRANMTPLAAQFEERGLLDRQPADGRSQGLRLTEAGHALACAARSIIAANEAHFLSGLSPEEQAGLRALLLSLRTAQAPTTES